MKDPTPEQKEKILKAFDRNEDFLKEFIRDYRKNPEAWDIMSDEERMKEFALSITPEDIENCFGEYDVPEEIFLAFSSGSEEEKFLALDSFSIGMVSALYKFKSKKTYRTKAKVEGNPISKLPHHIAMPTFNGYEYATSFHQEGKAYLQALVSMDNLQFQNGKLFFAGSYKQVSEVELQNFKTKEGIENFNLPLLRVYYSILLMKYNEFTQKKEKIPEVHKMFFPELADYLGLKRNSDEKTINAIIDDMRAFHNVVGILHITRNGRPDKSYYPVFNFEGYDASENSFSFSSPYLLHVIDAVYKEAIKNSAYNKRLGSKRTPRRLPSDTFLIKSAIAKERNKAAVENVFLIVQGMEKAGGNQYHIAATTLIERNEQLKKRLQESKNPRQLLKRCFKRTWELLRTMTELDKRYKNIRLPDPDDPAVIPTAKTLDSLIIVIPHEGKIQR